MSRFKNIEKLGLCLGYIGDDALVSAEELETLLQSAQVVYGLEGHWTTTQCEHDKFTGLLIGITPIKKKTKAEAALEFVKKCKDGDIYEMHANEVMIEAKRILEMKDEV